MSPFQRTCTAISVLLIGFVFLFSGCGGEKEQYKPHGNKLIILGFDGADPGLVNRWMAEGKLPNLQRLKEMGDYRELGSTIPPQSPVAWSSFATGTNPGGHGIYDFIHRTPENYLPGVSTLEIKPSDLFLGLIPTDPPRAEVTRGGTPFWNIVADAGVHATLLTIPYTFPPDNVAPGRMLSGLGVPDLRETNSTFTYMATDLTKEELDTPVGGGKLIKVNVINGVIATNLEAMIHPKKDERIQIPVSFNVRRDESVEVRLSGKTTILEPGEWSQWLQFDCKITPFFKTSGICRMYLFTSKPEFRLYITPLCIDPTKPYLPMSFPKEFAKELVEKVGYFKTVGWYYDTSALNEERMTDELFVEDMKQLTAERDRIFLSELESGDWDLFIGAFTDTDRAAHMFWRFMDAGSPLYDPLATVNIGNPIEWTYLHMDRFVGRVMTDYVDENTTLIVMSDHGFHGFRRAFHTNTWLVQNGYLFLRGMERLAPGAEIPKELYPKGEFFQNVVWNKTKAYAMGTGQIYINLKGREGQGMVKPGEEYNQIVDEIVAGLLEVRDPQDGKPVIRNVYKGKQVYTGSFADKSPDLQLAFHDGYRTSKETMLGGIPPELLTNNLSKWSGDHS
ncbi:MAG: alkaline phosphatase family protein, partial [bacterium]